MENEKINNDVQIDFNDDLNTAEQLADDKQADDFALMASNQSDLELAKMTRIAFSKDIDITKPIPDIKFY